jgi:hypothetical protein
MAGVIWCLPSIDPEWRDACMASLHPTIRTRLLLVDNSTDNAGIATSWNLGILKAERVGAEWLVLLSECMNFGRYGGLDFERRLTPPWTDCGYNWHLIAYHIDTLHAVGRFDETYWPGYFEDQDYERRLELSGFPSPRGLDRSRPPIEGIDVTERGSGHSIASRLVRIDLGVQAARYATKHGGPKGSETYSTPYGNPALKWSDVTLGEAYRANHGATRGE